MPLLSICAGCECADIARRKHENEHYACMTDVIVMSDIIYKVILVEYHDGLPYAVHITG